MLQDTLEVKKDFMNWLDRNISDGREGSWEKIKRTPGCFRHLCLPLYSFFLSKASEDILQSGVRLQLLVGGINNIGYIEGVSCGWCVPLMKKYLYSRKDYVVKGFQKQVEEFNTLQGSSGGCSVFRLFQALIPGNSGLPPAKHRSAKVASASISESGTATSRPSK